MKIDMGESLCYSWLRHIEQCQVVQTNWKVSPRWVRKHEDELQAIKDATDTHFKDRHIYKSSSFPQIFRQGECDALGIRLEDGKIKVYAVDVAVHEQGLLYGANKETTAETVIKKCLRSAMCLYGYLDIKKDAEIVFASPKVYKAPLSLLLPCIEDANEILRSLGFDFNVRLIVNNDFNDLILQPLLQISGKVSDTSELFLRSYQIYQLCAGQKTAEEKPNPKTAHE